MALWQPRARAGAAQLRVCYRPNVEFGEDCEMRAVRLAAVAAVMVLSSVAQAQTVIDGDTIEYKGANVHLWGIDAPEKGQTCADGWQAGKLATDYLAGLMRGKQVTCELKAATAPDKLNYALCKANGQDLSAAMASAGMAWALISQTPDYTVQESTAMSQVQGVHGNACMKAWEWRAKQKP